MLLMTVIYLTLVYGVVSVVDDGIVRNPYLIFIFVVDDECEPNPCLYGGVCRNKVGGVRCICEPGYSGDYCEGKVLLDENICDHDV